MCSDHTRLPSQKQQPCSFSTPSPSSQSALCIYIVYPACIYQSSSFISCPSINVNCCGPNLALLSHTARPDHSTGTLWTLHFITFVFYWLEMFFSLSNREINCPGLVLTAHLIFCSMWWSALERGPVAIKKLTALRPVSGEIYCNNQVVSGHGQGSYIWKYAMVIMIIGLLYKHWHSA